MLQEDLLPVPALLFQGSLLLGGIAKAVLGPGATSGGPTLVHPFLVSGWCGLVVTALNLLPVGSLDGGRMVQACTPSCGSIHACACMSQLAAVAIRGACMMECCAESLQTVLQMYDHMLPSWPSHALGTQQRVRPSKLCYMFLDCYMLVTQAAYGKSALAATSFFTYVGLGLGFLASTLSLPFGVFVLLCQREPVRYIQVLPIPALSLSPSSCLILLCISALLLNMSHPCKAGWPPRDLFCVQDNVTPAGQARQISVGLAVLVAILILLPMAPETTESMGSMPPSMYL